MWNPPPAAPPAPYRPNPWANPWVVAGTVAVVVVAATVVGVAVAATRQGGFVPVPPDESFPSSPVLCFVHAGKNVCVWVRGEGVGLGGRQHFYYTIDNGSRSTGFFSAEDARAAAVALIDGT